MFPIDKRQKNTVLFSTGSDLLKNRLARRHKDPSRTSRATGFRTPDNLIPVRENM
jgi:hypothetical protein